MAQFFDEQRHAAGIAVNACNQERVGLGQPSSHRRSVSAPWNGVRVRCGAPEIQSAPSSRGRLARRTRGPLGSRSRASSNWRVASVSPLPVVDHQRRWGDCRQSGQEGQQVTDPVAGGDLVSARLRTAHDQSNDGFDVQAISVGKRRMPKCPNGLGGLVFRHLGPNAEEAPQHLQKRLQDLGANITLQLPCNNVIAPPSQRCRSSSSNRVLPRPAPPTTTAQREWAVAGRLRKPSSEAMISSRPIKGVKPRRAVLSKRRVTELRPSTARRRGMPDPGPVACNRDRARRNWHAAREHPG